MRNAYLRLAYITAVSIANVLIAIKTGNQGYEVFLATTLAAALLFAWLFARLIIKFFNSDQHMAFKIVGSLAIFCVWFFGFGATTLSFPNAEMGAAELPAVNEWLVLVGVIPYFVPRLGLIAKKASGEHLLTGFVATFYSVLVLYFASIGFYNPINDSRALILIIAVQVQVIINYLLVGTNFLYDLRTATVKASHRVGIHNENSHSSLFLVLGGALFTLPLMVLLALAI